MTPEELFQMRMAMNKFGGSFICGLAVALSRADQRNTARLLAAFPDVVAKYGPGSGAFNAVAEEVQS